MAELGLTCNFCHQTGSNLRRCTHCLNAHYCSKTCQTLEWPVHRRVCKRPTQSQIKQGRETKGGDNDGEVKEESSKRDADIDVESQGEGQNVTECTHCGVLGNHKRCSRCKNVYYCSRKCQQNDWSEHRNVCQKKLSEIDKRINEGYQRKKKQVVQAGILEEESNSTTFTNFLFSQRFLHELTPEQARIRVPRPRGSLQAAIMLAKLKFPGFRIVTSFDDVPHENNFLFMPFAFLGARNMLVSYMYRYHEHAMRHGVYLMDEEDHLSKVEFYLDEYFDNPMPFFRYDQVKPGGYICLLNPVMHVFADGTVGIRINHPHEVAIIDV